MASLIDPAVAPPGPILPPGHPFTNVRMAVYWSATLTANDPDFALVVDFVDGDVAFNGKFGSSPHVWCVRGAMNADAY